VRVRIGFDLLEPRILPDMGVKVRFLGDEPAPGKAGPAGTVLVPTEAMVKDAGKDYAWRVVEGRARRVAVTLGSLRDGSMEVTTGLQAGDTLIATPPATLAEGARVRVAQ
jgi:hypothetical protein